MIKNYKHLCILFPGGAGGNHLTNLISTCQEFNKIWDSKDYINEFIKKYNDITDIMPFSPNKNSIHTSKVHFTESMNLQFLKNTEERDKLINNDKINILPGHWGCFYEAITNDVMLPIKDCLWLVMSVPKVGSLAYDRAVKGEFGILNPANYTLPQYIYTTYLTEENGCIFDTDMFITVDGWDYASSFIEENLGITLPKNTKKMHEIWINNIIESVKF